MKRENLLKKKHEARREDRLQITGRNSRTEGSATTESGTSTCIYM